MLAQMLRFITCPDPLRRSRIGLVTSNQPNRSVYQAAHKKFTESNIY